VTDGERTFWHWQSTFDAPRGRERELADMVGTGVYEGGFEGLRAYLRRSRPPPARLTADPRWIAPEETLPTQGVAGETVLVHAAAGGVGLFLCQWARALDAKVIGTVSSEDKARLARANGCELPLVGDDYRFAPVVKAASGGRGADVIYDGLGRAAMEENLEALALCGHWVSYGQASGPLPPIASEPLAAKSATLSRPVLFHYTAERPCSTRLRARRSRRSTPV
jgi:NADPH:quinone reductase-like Zn-dependent oxidoreductase